MNQDQPNSLLSIDIQIRIRTKAYCFQVKDALKWIVPIVAIIVRVIAELRRSVRWAAHESGGLKSLRRPDEGRRIQMAGVIPCWPVTKGTGGQGVRSDPESEGFEEKYRAVINGGYPDDEQVGQRWGKVEPALWGQRRSHSPIAPRCLLAARYGRFMRDPRRPARVPALSRVSDLISQKRNGKRCSGRSRRTE